MYRVLLKGQVNHRFGIIKMDYGEDLPLPLDFVTYPMVKPHCYPESGYQYWYVEKKVRERFRGDYQLSYFRPYWIFDFVFPGDATLFKLMWGGHV